METTTLAFSFQRFAVGVIADVTKVVFFPSTVTEYKFPMNVKHRIGIIETKT